MPRYYPPRQIVPTQESLSVRLKNTGTMAGPPYACISMPVLRFIQAASELTGDPRFQDVFNSIQPYLENDRALFREAIYSLYYSQAPERTKLLYNILVAPFAKL